MKRMLSLLFLSAVVPTVFAQLQPETRTPDRVASQRIEEYFSHLVPDSIQLRTPLLPSAEFFSRMTTVATPVVSMSSVMEIRSKYRTRKIEIISYKARSGWFTLSNGQARNWSPYPDGHLDARTLSFPVSRR